MAGAGATSKKLWESTAYDYNFIPFKLEKMWNDTDFELVMKCVPSVQVLYIKKTMLKMVHQGAVLGKQLMVYISIFGENFILETLLAELVFKDQKLMFTHTLLASYLNVL